MVYCHEQILKSVNYVSYQLFQFSLLNSGISNIKSGWFLFQSALDFYIHFPEQLLNSLGSKSWLLCFITCGKSLRPRELLFFICKIEMVISFSKGCWEWNKISCVKDLIPLLEHSMSFLLGKLDYHCLQAVLSILWWETLEYKKSKTPTYLISRDGRLSDKSNCSQH